MGKVLVFVGGVRGVLKKYIKDGWSVVWILHSREYQQSDRCFHVKNLIIINDFSLDAVLGSVKNITYIQGAKFVSFHDDYHFLANEMATHFKGVCFLTLSW
ncbi:hypothetical protein [Facilibium subflavum]|uniref:hypothetical protein n=1 Tax=Facilibium subflavum TaxID=2219058 RepID=UPI000E6511C9|nr:hypothetical protein [Facilibium subflavum]